MQFCYLVYFFFKLECENEVIIKMLRMNGAAAGKMYTILTLDSLSLLDRFARVFCLKFFMWCQISNQYFFLFQRHFLTHDTLPQHYSSLEEIAKTISNLIKQIHCINQRVYKNIKCFHTEDHCNVCIHI